MDELKVAQALTYAMESLENGASAREIYNFLGGMRDCAVESMDEGAVSGGGILGTEGYQDEWSLEKEDAQTEEYYKDVDGEITTLERGIARCKTTKELKDYLKQRGSDYRMIEDAMHHKFYEDITSSQQKALIRRLEEVDKKAKEKGIDLDKSLSRTWIDLHKRLIAAVGASAAVGGAYAAGHYKVPKKGYDKVRGWFKKGEDAAKKADK